MNIQKFYKYIYSMTPTVQVESKAFINEILFNF